MATNYSLVANTDVLRGVFANRYTPPLWLYTNVPRVPEDKPYINALDFTTQAGKDFIAYFAPQEGDTLEMFLLEKRVLLIGAEIEIVKPADVVLDIVTNSNQFFDQVDCRVAKKLTYLVNGGVLDRNTSIPLHSILIDDPDYLGLRIATGAGNLGELALKITLAVNDTFEWWAKSNSSKYGNMSWIV